MPTDQQKPDEKPTRRSRVSSAYERTVGDVHIAVINTRQNPDDVPKKARDKKWAVIATHPTKSGGSRRVTVAMNDRKYDAIDKLLIHERQLKAALDDKKSDE